MYSGALSNRMRNFDPRADFILAPVLLPRIVDHLMEFKNSPEMDDYHYLDPKQLRVTEIPRNRSPFQDAIVFIVGGGNYIEYQNLVDYAKQKTSAGNTKRITYGSSTLANAKQFLKQLSLLGQEII
jgi:hypothetical protein